MSAHNGLKYMGLCIAYVPFGHVSLIMPEVEDWEDRRRQAREQVQRYIQKSVNCSTNR